MKCIITHFLLSSNQFSSKFPIMSVSPRLATVATTYLRVIRPWCHGGVGVMTCSHHVAKLGAAQ